MSTAMPAPWHVAPLPRQSFAPGRGLARPGVYRSPTHPNSQRPVSKLNMYAIYSLPGQGTLFCHLHCAIIP